MMIVAATVGGCAGHVSPPGAASPDRPGFTDTPPALPRGAFQLEAGYTDDRTEGSEYQTIGETLLRIGVGARSEVRLFGNSYATRWASGLPTVHGIEDQKVGIKTNLYASADSLHSAVPNIALLAATTLPTGADGITAGSAQPEVKLAMNWTTASPFSLYSNFGFGSIANEVGRAERAWTSLAAWWSVNARVSVFAEGLTIGRVSGSGSGTAGTFVDGGVTYLINDRFQLDVRLGRGVGSETSTDRFIGAGFARRW